MRTNQRGARELRTIRIVPGYAKHAEGSALVEFGDTHVLCTASIEERVPPHLINSGKGWVTAEYGMLPRSTHTRSQREAAKGKQGGRTMEIQRLIGRALRSSVDLSAIGPRTFTIDCDVIQADGGTRTASITGGYVALALALRKLQKPPKARAVAAVSVGLIRGEARLRSRLLRRTRPPASTSTLWPMRRLSSSRCREPVRAAPFSRAQLDELADLGLLGIAELIQKQREALLG